MDRRPNLHAPLSSRLILPFVLLFLASCSPAAETVSFMISGDPAERQAYLDLVAAFEEAHPEIETEVTHIPSASAYRDRLATEFAAGTPPDVTLMNYRRYPTYPNPLPGAGRPAMVCRFASGAWCGSQPA